ncbi:Membrane associated eicosanoid/glutathione metabolism-like domain superfamily protein [Abortiporus biennis]
MPTTLNTPLSLYSIPVVWAVGIWPARKRIGLIERNIGFDNKQPRDNIGKLTDEYQHVDQEKIDTASRMESAHNNSLEMFPLWIGAVLAGNQVGLDNWTLNVASIAFIGIRLAYSYIYVNQKTDRQATLRSIAWLASISIPMTLIIKAANKTKAIGQFRGIAT